MAACAIITAIICVLITVVAVIVSFATPNWIRLERSPNLPEVCNNCDIGMWLYCGTSGSSTGSIDDCRWYFSNEFLVEKKLPGSKKGAKNSKSMACHAC